MYDRIKESVNSRCHFFDGPYINDGLRFTTEEHQ